MKAAFHFNSDHPALEGDYGWEAEKLIFSSLLRYPNLSVHSKIFAGDLFVWALVDNEIFGPDEGETDSRLGRLSKLVEYWLHTGNAIRTNISTKRLFEESAKHIIYAVCFESIELSLVGYLHKELSELTDAYIGVIEVDDMSKLHWSLYSAKLSPSYRITNKNLAIFWDNVSGDDKPNWLLEECQHLGFKTSFEGLNMRYTSLDKNFNFENARRAAEWKRRCGHMLAFVADNVVHRLEDTAPKLSEMLWATIIAFEDAEIDYQYTEVAKHCRTIFEYTTDRIFPPRDEEIDGHKLGKSQFRNRLLAFVGAQRKSDSNVDLVCASTETWVEQIEKLSKLTNKGVHDEVRRDEARRCLLRTIMLLDDIIALKPNAFAIRAELDIDIHDVRNWL